MLSFCWGKLIQFYRGQGNNYGQIFKYLYTIGGIVIAMMFVAIILLEVQKGYLFSRVASPKMQMEEA